MYRLIFHQINVVELAREKEIIQQLRQDETNFLLGLEVSILELSGLLHMNLDPQHNINNYDDHSTCLEDMINNLSLFSSMQDKNIHIFFLKPDLDSISAASILDIYLSGITINDTIMNRVKSIADYDRHGRFISSQKESKIMIPSGLFVFISGWKNTINQKVQYVRSWILTGSFCEMSQYDKIAIKNFYHAIHHTKIEIIIPNQLVFIKSSFRGACGIGYKIAPIVIALNPSYRFGFGKNRLYGKKWIIGQYNNNFLNMIDLVNNLIKTESGWGGSNTIIGSPQDKPSKLDKSLIIELVKENRRKNFA